MRDKVCTTCKALKLIGAFNKDKTNKDGYKLYCRKCQHKQQKMYYKSEHGKSVAKITNFKFYHSKGWLHRLDKVYGKGASKYYKTQLVKQEYCCALCGKSQAEFKRRLALDHDHETNRWRGLLCARCNSEIGKFELYKIKYMEYLNSPIQLVEMKGGDAQ